MNRNDKLEVFVEWAISRNIFIDNRVTFNVDKNKGIYATSKGIIEAGSNIIEVPKNSIIGPHLYTDYFQDFEFENLKGQDGNQLTLLLISMLRCQNESSFKPYFDILSENPNIPYLWNAEAREILRGTDAGALLESKLLGVYQEWQSLLRSILINTNDKRLQNQIHEDLNTYGDASSSNEFSRLYSYSNSFDISWTSFDSYLWAFTILSSRGFPYLLISNHVDPSVLSKAVLIPVFDLLNHDDDSKIKWLDMNTSKAASVGFIVNENVDNNVELFNNYGKKSNTEFLLSYGYLPLNNIHDKSTISLQISEDGIREAIEMGIDFYSEGKIVKDPKCLARGINFDVSRSDPLPLNLVSIFAYLVRLNFERDQKITLRMVLEGLSELKKVLESKIRFFKTKINNIPSISPDVLGLIKLYKQSQKGIFQGSLDSLLNFEKEIIKSYHCNLTSFKTILKKDDEFFKDLSSFLQLRTYDEILKKGKLSDVFLLWLVRVSNIKQYISNKFLNAREYSDVISFTLEQFSDVSKLTEVTSDDISDYEYFSKAYINAFPSNRKDIKNGDWSITNFVFASIVSDRISYIRPSSGELFIVEKKSFIFSK